MSTPVFLLGSGRSGTTWLMDTLARANRLWTVFEPLNPLANPKASPYANRFHAKENPLPELKAILDEGVYGRRRNAWTGYRFYADDLKYSWRRGLGAPLAYHYQMCARYGKVFDREVALFRGRNNRAIVKFIRANLLIGWLQANYNCHILYMVRHPAAVIRSRMKLNNRYWNYFEEQQQKVLGSYLQMLNGNGLYDITIGAEEEAEIKTNEISGCAFMWCVENAYTHTFALQNNYKIIYYEELFTDPKKILEETARYAGLVHCPEEEHFKTPSQQSSKQQRENGIGADQLRLWLDRFSPEDLKRIQHMLDRFAVDFYQADAPLPLHRVNSDD
jgi:hypothetical protein